MKHQIHSFDLLTEKELFQLDMGENSDNRRGTQTAAECLVEIADEILTKRQKEVLYGVMRGKKQVEIAEELGIHKSTVSRIYHRSLLKLREHTKYMARFLR